MQSTRLSIENYPHKVKNSLYGRPTKSVNVSSFHCTYQPSQARCGIQLLLQCASQLLKFLKQTRETALIRLCLLLPGDQWSWRKEERSKATYIKQEGSIKHPYLSTILAVYIANKITG
jgi:hypothetical protein